MTPEQERLQIAVERQNRLRGFDTTEGINRHDVAPDEFHLLATNGRNSLYQHAGGNCVYVTVTDDEIVCLDIPKNAHEGTRGTFDRAEVVA